MNQILNGSRILAISLSSRGFGYAVMEGNSTLVDYGNMRFDKYKNARALVRIKQMIIRNQPDFLVLQDVNAKGARRHPRIKALHRKVVTLATKHEIKVVKISGAELRTALLNSPKGTKHEMAELLAKQFPDELASRLPPERLFYDSEDVRMDIFEAVALTVTFQKTSK